MDELETYELDRRLRPLTVPVLIHEPTWFVVDLQVAPLAPRGGLAPRHERRKQRNIEREGPRTSGSTDAVDCCLTTAAELLSPECVATLRTDRKETYATIAKQRFPSAIRHVRISSRERRGLDNPLFRINRTLAMLRDGVSRLVRRTWAASKRSEWLTRHLWIWVTYRNYVRRMINRTREHSAASMLGLFRTRLALADLLGLRAEFRSDPPGLCTAS